MTQFTAFGISAKKKMLDEGISQKQLAERITEKTALYTDSAYISNIFAGKRTPPKIINAICEILDITYEQSEKSVQESGTR